MHCHISGYLLQLRINLHVHTDYYLLLCEHETKFNFSFVIIPMKINLGNDITYVTLNFCMTGMNVS
jgi:hypothetical protein